MKMFTQLFIPRNRLYVPCLIAPRLIVPYVQRSHSNRLITGVNPYNIFVAEIERKKAISKLRESIKETGAFQPKNFQYGLYKINIPVNENINNINRGVRGNKLSSMAEINGYFNNKILKNEFRAIIKQSPAEILSRKCTFEKMKNILNLEANSYEELPLFDGGFTKTPDEIRDTVIDEILKIHQELSLANNANKVSQSEIISKVIYGIVDSSMRIYRYHKMSGSYDEEEFVDWVIKKGSSIVAVVNGKADMNEGIAQNIIQLQAYNMPMYGIISTGADWAIIKVVPKNSSVKGVEAYLSSRPPISLPINKQVLTRDDLMEPIEDLLGQIKWIFDH